MSIPGHGPDDRDMWMTMFHVLDDDEVEALLDGRGLADDTPLSGLALVADRLRASARREPVPPMSAALRAQIEQRDVVALRPARAAQRSIRRGLAVAAAAAVLALIGAGADQNRLPAGAQDVVSSVAEAVGVDVPRADERHADDSTDAEDGDRGAGNGSDAGTTGGATPDTATPADPGTPGDKSPATPAVPPEQANGGEGPSGTPAITAPGQVRPVTPGPDADADLQTPTANTNADQNAGGGPATPPSTGRGRD